MSKVNITICNTLEEILFNIQQITIKPTPFIFCLRYYISNILQIQTLTKCHIYLLLLYVCYCSTISTIITHQALMGSICTMTLYDSFLFKYIFLVCSREYNFRKENITELDILKLLAGYILTKCITAIEKYKCIYFWLNFFKYDCFKIQLSNSFTYNTDTFKPKPLIQKQYFAESHKFNFL